MKIFLMLLMIYFILAMFAFIWLYFYFVINMDLYDDKRAKNNLLFGVNFIGYCIYHLKKLKSEKGFPKDMYHKNLYIIKATKRLVFLFHFCFPMYLIIKVIAEIIDTMFFLMKFSKR